MVPRFACCVIFTRGGQATEFLELPGKLTRSIPRLPDERSLTEPSRKRTRLRNKSECRKRNGLHTVGTLQPRR